MVIRLFFEFVCLSSTFSSKFIQVYSRAPLPCSHDQHVHKNNAFTEVGQTGSKREPLAHVLLICTHFGQTENSEAQTAYCATFGMRTFSPRTIRPGITGQNIPRPGYTRPITLYIKAARGILWPRPILTPSGQIIAP